MCGDTERRVMMEASPTSSFIMPEAEFLFQVLVIALDAPAQFRDGGLQTGGGLNADHIRKTERGDAVAKFSVDTIPGIGEHRRGCDAGLKCGADLSERHFRFGLERNLIWHARPAASRRIIGPGAR